MPNSPEGGCSPSPPQNRKSLMHSREFGQWTNPSIEISDWSSCVLCQEEGRLPPSGAGLPEVEQDHSEKLLPASASLRCAHQAMRCGVVHYLGPPLGLQQCPTEGRGEAEGSLLHELRTVQAACHVLWTMQLASYLPDDDE